jgi:hypothetical protein
MSPRDRKDRPTTPSKRPSRTGRTAPGRKGRRPFSAPRPAAPFLQVAELREMHDYWGRRLPRPIPSGLLRSAIHDHLAQTPNLLLESLSVLLDRPVVVSDLTEVKVVLFQEGEFQYIFRVTVRPRGMSRVHLAMVVAKDGHKVSKLARREMANLQHLRRRDERRVVRPLSGGMLAVDPGGPPARAAVFVYFTPWLTGLHELGVDRRMNFFINEQPFHTFRPAASDIIRSQVLAILLGFWDPVEQTVPEPPQIASGDFVISRPASGQPVQLCLIACRRILTSVSLARCLRLFLGYRGHWAEKEFHLLPKEPRLLFEALDEGLVIKNQGHVTWDRIEQELRSYLSELQRHPTVEGEWSPLPSLRRLMGSLHMFKPRP